tara:strand:- start:196 stop:1155 length:960 start_codon:yes stop_codon:yes gene_type:complete
VRTKNILFILILIIVNCSKPGPVEYSELKLKDGIYYKGFRPYTGQVVVYNGNDLNKEISYKNGKRHGKWIKYRGIDIKSEERNYVDGKIEGYHIYYNDFGVKQIEVYCSQKIDKIPPQPFDSFPGREYIVFNGPYISYFDNGMVEYKTVYNNGKFDGEQVDYYRNGNLKEIKRLKYFPDLDNSLTIGDLKKYYENGNIELEVTYNMTKDLKSTSPIGYFKTFHRNGNLESSVFYDYETRKRDGKEEEYYDNGQLKKVFNWIQGEVTGNFTEYYKNGSIKEKGFYKNNRKDGRSIYYFENGYVWIRDYQNGDIISDSLLK